MRYYSFIIIFLMLLTIIPKASNSQVVNATGNATEASSQLVYYYDQTDGEDSVIQVTNTNDTQGITVHVQLFRSYDPDDDANTPNAVICEERDFVDFLTPNDTHLYDLNDDNFTTNAGETETDPGEETSITGTNDTKGFVVITPVVSEADLSAISFEHLIGSTTANNDLFLNAMGRSAVDLATGDVVADGTVLDGVTSGFELLQPEELVFNFTDDSDKDIVGITFKDTYGPAGLLGYAVDQGDASWTSFIFDYKEDPTSCGNRDVSCFLTLGLNDNIGQNNDEFTGQLSDEDLLCAGTETPPHPDGSLPSIGWTRMFVSGLAETENHLGVLVNPADADATWMYTNKDEVENHVVKAPTGVTSRATSQLIYYFDQFFTTIETQVTNTNDTEGVWVHVQIFRNLNTDNMEDILCDERNFVDFLTPNDTHYYRLQADNFPKNIGETAALPGESTSISLANDPSGFIVITPVVSEADLSAISFQHLIGTAVGPTERFAVNAMGRDAVDLTTGQILPDGTILDGHTSGFLLLQPEELLFSFNGTDDVDVVGIAFDDNYGPEGLLGYAVTPSDVTWTSFIFDYKEDPTSCGQTPVTCFQTVGLNETKQQANSVINTTNDEILLCSGATTPDEPGSFGDPVGWTRIFVSGLGEQTNHIGFFVDSRLGGEHMYVRGEREIIDPEPPAEDCTVEGDEDEDGFANCLDTDCATAEECETGETECTDEMDNDEDGDTDCADLGCDGFAGCEFGEEVSCDDGIDNDADGAVDGDDTDCQEETTGGDGGDGGGCVVTGTVSGSTSAVNFLIMMLPFIGVFGIRRIRRQSLYLRA